MKIDPNVTSTPNSASSLTGGAQRTAQGDASTQTAATPAATPAAPTVATSAAATSTNAAATETVNISTISTQLRAAGLSGDIDTKKVSEIRNQISNGQLVINSANIADGILQTARDLVYAPQEEE